MTLNRQQSPPDARQFLHGSRELDLQRDAVFAGIHQECANIRHAFRKLWWQIVAMTIVQTVIVIALVELI
ncbi:hypothetical protein [Rhodovibrio sodomensis]|uniref:hypothetical protein n=1 Tax=Rhodovibrio sodomensis TaxID=1088 RepID=UPI001902F0B6|nr:hypothetical protein [Rhodovibrio sodomensis]